MQLKPADHRKVIDLIVRAGQEALRVRDSGQLNPVLKTENDYSVVTDGDKAAHEILTSGLTKLFPGTKIISEEDQTHDATGSYASGWVIDPIDGTKDYASGGPGFGVLAAYVENGVPVHGFAYFPAKEYSAVYSTSAEGKKSYKQSVNIGENDEISYGRPTELHTRSTVATPRIAQKYTDVKDFFPGTYTLVVQHPSPGRNFAMLENHADITAGPHTMMDWDLAAVDAIARNAGAIFVNTETKKPLTYGEQRTPDRAFMQPRYIAGNIETLKNLGLIEEKSLASSRRK